MLYSSQTRAAELIVGLEGISCEESLRTRGLLSLEKTNLRGNLVASTTSCGGKAEREVLVFPLWYLMTGHVG